MKERPILMNAAMVRAILDGRKTQTRRPVKPQPYTIPWRDAYGNADEALFWRYDESREDWPYPRFCPLGQIGDRLWVRETWAEALGSSFAAPLERYRQGGADGYGIGAIYRATPHPDYRVETWRPSIHMPRWASRIILEITDVRVERVQDITDDDAVADLGCLRICDEDEPCDTSVTSTDPVGDFRALWDSIYYPGIYKKQTLFKWDANPWVWVVEFRRVEA